MVPLLFSSPLYIVGCDLGRWFAVTLINFSLITLSSDIHYLEKLYNPQTNKISDKKSLINIKNKSNVINGYNTLVLFIILFFIRLPHYCSSAFQLFAEPMKSFLMRIINLL